jgi:hypothetical protein
MASNGLLNSLANNLIFTYFSKIDNGFFLSTWNRIDAFVGVAFKQFAGIASKIFFPKFVNGVSNSQSSRMVVSYISAVFVLYNFSLLSKLNIIKIFGLSAFFKVTSTFELVLLFVVTDSLISLFNSLLKSQGNVIGVYALSFVRFLPFGFLLMQSYQNLELVLSISLLISFLYFIIFCKVRSRVIFILYFSVVLNLYFSYFYLVFLFLFFLLLILNYLNLSKVELIIKRWLKTEI